MKENIGIAVVGCGYWGVNYIRVFNELSRSQVVAICDIQDARLQEVGQSYPRVSLYQDVEDMLQLDEIDAVVVTTNATTHHQIASLCLEAGKNVLIEKPVATKISDADQLIQLSNANGTILMVGHTFLYNPGIRKVKEYIDQASVGNIHYLYARRTNLGPIRQDVNALWDLAPHDISIFNHPWISRWHHWKYSCKLGRSKQG
jgi:predicted dehydrogenase